MLDTAVEVVGNVDIMTDSLFVVKEAAFGFLTDAKESPYPWMFAAAYVAGALPLAIVFFGFQWIECSREIVQCGLVSVGG